MIEFIADVLQLPLVGEKEGMFPAWKVLVMLLIVMMGQVTGGIRLTTNLFQHPRFYGGEDKSEWVWLSEKIDYMQTEFERIGK